MARSFGKLRTISTCSAPPPLRSAAAAFAWSFDALTIMRTAAGIVAGGVIPAAMAAIGDRAPDGRRQVQLGRFLV